MRIAHLVVTYTSPLQTERMIRLMRHPAFDFYIHVDKKIDIAPYLFLGKLPNVYLIQDRVNVIWAGYNTVDATMRCVKEIFRTGRQYDYIHLMSGQDYPIKSAEYIYNFFREHKGKEFLQYKHFDDWADRAYPRIRKYHLTNFNFPGKHYIERVINTFLSDRKSPIDMEYYGSSMFWALTSECLVYIIDLMDNNTSLRRFMKFSWAPDEFMFQTLALNSSFKENVINDNLIYLEMEDGHSHPNIMTLGHFQKLMHSHKLFARKFDMHKDATILDKLDRYLTSSAAATQPDLALPISA